MCITQNYKRENETSPIYENSPMSKTSSSGYFFPRSSGVYSVPEVLILNAPAPVRRVARLKVDEGDERTALDATKAEWSVERSFIWERIIDEGHETSSELVQWWWLPRKRRGNRKMPWVHVGHVGGPLGFGTSAVSRWISGFLPKQKETRIYPNHESKTAKQADLSTEQPTWKAGDAPTSAPILLIFDHNWTLLYCIEWHRAIEVLRNWSEERKPHKQGTPQTRRA